MFAKLALIVPVPFMKALVLLCVAFPRIIFPLVVHLVKKNPSLGLHCIAIIDPGSKYRAPVGSTTPLISASGTMFTSHCIL